LDATNISIKTSKPTDEYEISLDVSITDEYFSGTHTSRHMDMDVPLEYSPMTEHKTSNKMYYTLHT
jgi:hypothetical protein